jgi:hypothetical protein
MRSKLLGIAIIATMSLTACNSGSGGSDAGTKAAACARVTTITTQLADMQEQIRKVSIQEGPIASAPERQSLERQKVPLKVELKVQNQVCSG